MIPPIRLSLGIRFDDAMPSLPPRPDLDAAIRRASLAAAEYARGVWTAAAGRAGLHSTGAYVRGIAAAAPVVRETGSGASFAVTVELLNTAPHAGVVEDGHALIRLPQQIDWSRAKRSKTSTPYLRIPFRASAYQSAERAARSGATAATRRAMMPADVYAQAKRLKAGQRLGAVPGDERRGARVVGRDASGAEVSNPAWKAGKAEGMQKRGPRGQTSYGTVRTITPASQGWNIPAQPGKRIAAAVTADLARSPDVAGIVEAEIAAALGLR